MSRKKFSFAQQKAIKQAGLALQRSGALWPGCRVGIAVSGGVDSFCLLQTMKIRQKITPFKFEIMALHIDPGFGGNERARLARWLATAGISGHVLSGNFGPAAHSPQNLKNSPCFYCARQRRKLLFELCAQYRLTHLAFGHNAEDLLSTYLMNFCRNGNMDTMKIAEDFFHGALRVIRPLLLTDKKFLLQAARQWALPVWANSCPSAGQTARQQALDLARSIEAAHTGALRSMTNALIRRELESYVSSGGRAACG